MKESDILIQNVLRQARTVAVVGFSANPARPSHDVARYLQMQGYRIIPVNPGLAGHTFLGETVFGSLSDVPEDVDMIDIFRQSSVVPGLVAEGLEHWPSLKSIWMQIGISHAEAAETARARGVDVVENRCPKIEIPRLFPDRRA